MSRFVRWSGDCSQATTSTCTLTLDTTAHVGADFEPAARQHSAPAPVITDVYSDHYGDDGLVEINCRGLCTSPLRVLNPLAYDDYRSPASVVTFQVSSSAGAKISWKVCDMSRASKPCIDGTGSTLPGSIATLQAFSVWADTTTKATVDTTNGHLAVNPGDRLEIIATDSFGGTSAF